MRLKNGRRRRETGGDGLSGYFRRDKIMKKSIVILIVLNIMVALALPMVCSVETENVYENNDMFLRLHVRANSDGEEDQELKLKVRDTVLSKTSALLKNCESKESAISILSKNFDLIEKEAEKTVAENGYDYPVSVEIKKEHFEYREYEGFFLPEDTYDSLIVTIGSGEGHNWWCVVFPAICLSGSSTTVAAEEEDSEKSNDEKNENQDGEEEGDKSGENVSSSKEPDVNEDEEKTDDSVSASVEVDLSAVPEEYHLAEKTVPQEVKYDFWIVRFFKSLFGIK